MGKAVAVGLVILAVAAVFAATWRGLATAGAALPIDCSQANGQHCERYPFGDGK